MSDHLSHREAAAGRRRTDPEQEDHRDERRGEGNGIDAGYKGARLGAHGPLGILALVFLLVGGSAVFVIYQGFEDVKGLLREARHDHDLLSCVVSLTADERSRLRSVEHRREFSRLCPWLRTPMTSTHFAPSEFDCQCAKPDCPAPKDCHRLLRFYLDRMREMYGGPLVVTSGNRCTPWNQFKGGEATSEHVQPEGCTGCDLQCANSGQRWRMLDAARHAGFTRIGIYPRHLHVGVGEPPTFATNVVWVGAYRA